MTGRWNAGRICWPERVWTKKNRRCCARLQDAQEQNRRKGRRRSWARLSWSKSRSWPQRPAMRSGDTVRVHVKVREGDKERIQIFEGVVIGMHRGGTRASFTVRKVSFGQGVERIFPLHSPTIRRSKSMRSAKVRRAKLYYLRDLKGKAARMKDSRSKARRRSPASSTCLSSMVRVPAMRTLENTLRRVGFVHVAGVDEVGRGCLAGPVVAAAVVLHPEKHIPGVCDSKTGAGDRARAALRAHHAPRRRVGGRRGRSDRDRSHQHPPGVAARDAAGGAGAWRRFPTSSSSTRSACPSCRWRSAACCTAIAAARRLPPHRLSPR